MTAVRDRTVVSIASALVAGSALVPPSAPTLGGRDALRIGVAMVGVGASAFAALAYRGRARTCIVLLGGAAIATAADSGLEWLFGGGATRSAIVVDACLGLCGASGLLLAPWAARPRADERAIGNSFIVAGAWLLIASLLFTFLPTERQRFTAILGAAIGVAALLVGLAMKAGDAGARGAIRALGRAGLAMLGWSALLAAFGIAALGLIAGAAMHVSLASPPCDLERRFFSTAGTRIARVTGHELPNVSAWRIRRSDSLAYARVVGCRAETELVDSTELFALLVERERGRDPGELARLYDWVHHDGGEATLRIIDSAAEADAQNQLIRRPEVRDNVLSFWREDTNPSWTAPTTRTLHHVVDLWSGRFSTAPADDVAAAMLSDDVVADAGLHAARLRANVTSARALLAVAAADPSLDRRITALMMARGVADASFAEPLLVLAQRDPTPEVRAAAIMALDATGDARLKERAREIARTETDASAVTILRRGLSVPPR